MQQNGLLTNLNAPSLVFTETQETDDEVTAMTKAIDHMTSESHIVHTLTSHSY